MLPVELEGGGFRDRVFEDDPVVYPATRLDRHIGNHKVGDDDGRKIGVGFYLARIKGVKTVDASKIEIAVAAFEASVAVKFIALEAIGRVEVFNLVGAGIEAGQATV